MAERNVALGGTTDIVNEAKAKVDKVIADIDAKRQDALKRMVELNEVARLSPVRFDQCWKTIESYGRELGEHGRNRRKLEKLRQDLDPEAADLTATRQQIYAIYIKYF